MPEAITGRELFDKLAALTKEELALPVHLEGHCCYSDCSGVEHIPAKETTQGRNLWDHPAFLLLTRHES